MNSKLKNQMLKKINDWMDEVCDEEDLIYAVQKFKDELDKKRSQVGERQLSTQFVSDVLHNSNVVVFEWTMELEAPTRFVTDNIEQFGFVPDDFYTGSLKDYWEFIHPDDRALTKENLHAARRMGLHEFKHHYRIKTQCGQTRWVEERLFIERDSLGEPLSEKGVLLDITERKLLEMKLEQSKIRYQRLYENAAVMMFTFDVNGSIISANKKCVEIIGESRSKLLSRKIDSILTPSEQKKIKASKLLKQLKHHVEQEFEVDVLHVSGALLTLSIKLNPIFLNGELIEIEGIGHDITLKKEKERQLAYLTYHDKLTGLFNRAYLDDKLMQLERAGAYPFTLIVGDMNGLKDVNDLLGHEFGDQLLIEMSNILRGCCRETDIIARYGGDEFLVLIPQGDDIVAQRVLESIHQKTSDAAYSMLSPSIALGAATKHDDSISLEQLFQTADDAMYAQKIMCEHSSRSKLNEPLTVAIEKLPKKTRERSERLSKLAYPLGKMMGLNSDMLEQLQMAVTLHDIGQIGIPHQILFKKGKLENAEYELIKTHPEIGHRILTKYQIEEEVVNAVKYHHEWYDGSGYPYGIKGQSIPLSARIISVLEAYDSMIQVSSYRKKKTPKKAIEELINFSGSQFDNEVVQSLKNMVINDDLVNKDALTSKNN